MSFKVGRSKDLSCFGGSQNRVSEVLPDKVDVVSCQELHQIVLYLKFYLSDHFVNLIFLVALIVQKLIKRCIILHKLTFHLPQVRMYLTDIIVAFFAIGASQRACLWQEC